MASLPEIRQVDSQNPDPEIIARAAACLIRGGLVAFPTETVYGLGGHAFDPTAVRRIFAAKDRPSIDPLIVHLASADALPLVAREVPAAAQRLADAFWPGPLTLLLSRVDTLPMEVTAGLDTVAVRVPSHPVARALLKTAGVPVAAPSANRFSHTSPTLARHVLDDLGSRVDMILDAGPTPLGVESTVLDPLRQPAVILRPGGIPREEIERLIGPVRMAASGERTASSPGRQPRHYAPNARLILCDGETPGEIASSMGALADKLRKSGRSVGLLVASEVRQQIDRDLQTLPYQDLGSRENLSLVASRLFAGLRELELRKVDVILTHRMPSSGLGAAINDRLVRASHDTPDPASP